MARSGRIDSFSSEFVDPRVKFARITLPRDEILYLAFSFPGLQYSIRVETIVVGFYNFLNFRLVKLSFCTFSRQIGEFVRHRHSGHTTSNFEKFI